MHHPYINHQNLEQHLKRISMLHFFAKKDISQPNKSYHDLDCCLVQYQVPLLKHCYILCHEDKQPHGIQHSQLLCFAQQEAARLSMLHTGAHENFMMITSGEKIRRRANWHIHIFIVQHRWQKAYVYQMLGIKNLGLTLYHAIRSSSEKISSGFYRN